MSHFENGRQKALMEIKNILLPSHFMKDQPKNFDLGRGKKKRTVYNLYKGKQVFQTVSTESDANELVKLFKERDGIILTVKQELL